MRWYASLFFLALSISASAQQLDAQGHYITKPVRDRVGMILATQLTTGPQVQYFNDHEVGLLRQGLRDGSLAIRPGGENGQVFTSGGSFPLRHPQQARATSNILAAYNTGGLFEEFATIRLTVNPVPPRDYRVNINGEDCPATERGIYKVLPGQSSIEVSRQGKDACRWSGAIAGGKEKHVECPL